MATSDSALSAEKLYEEANELMINDQYEKALKVFATSIEKCDESNVTLLLNNRIRRCDALLKLKRNKEVLDEIELAVKISSDDSRVFLKKGIAQFNLNDFADALASFESGLGKADTDVKKELLNEWIDKCKQKLPPPKQPEVTAPAKPVQPAAIKHEWYQTDSQVTVSILIKNVLEKDVTINTTENKLSVQSNDTESLKLDLNFNLSNKIIPEKTQIKYLSNKIEIKLSKLEGNQWRKLEADEAPVVVIKKPEYPSSSKKAKDWDKIAADVAAEEKDEKLEGDSALNKLFQQVYQNGTDETRRAMNKSFSESGGTVLSTNWQDVGSKKLDIKPPDGMEWKEWDK